MTDYSDNKFQPGMVQDEYLPDQLIAGSFPIETDTVTIASGGAFKRGTVLGMITASGKYTEALAASNDGSQTPKVILADDVDATSADQNGGVYLTGEFNGNKLILGTGITLASAKAALRPNSIFVRSVVAAADPT